MFHSKDLHQKGQGKNINFRDPETDHPPEGGSTLINACPGCLKKQREIDGLKEEIQRLRQKLSYQARKEKEGFFGSSTPSAKLPLKANTDKGKQRKPKGARPGRTGAGRKGVSSLEVNRRIEVESTVGNHCPQCGTPLVDKGGKERLILESQPLQAEPILYRLPKKYCPRCHRLYQPSPPGVLPKHLFGNQFKTQILAAVDAPSMHRGIRRIPEIFLGNAPRLYHWAQDRQAPADNNLAQRDLRPTVIARKVSFGSVSDADAHTRGILMSALYSPKKHRFNVQYHLKSVLDQFAKDTSQDPCPFLFPKIPQPP